MRLIVSHSLVWVYYNVPIPVHKIHLTTYLVNIFTLRDLTIDPED